MAEDVITNPVVNETPVTQPVNEENTVAAQEPSQENQQIESNEIENSNTQREQIVGEQTTQEPTQQVSEEDLRNKLKQYELREEEERMMREKLGIKDVDSQTYSYMNLDQQIVNEGKQVYLRLCNEYGIDANPNNIDASIAKLKETEPAKAFEFERRFEQLGDEVSYRRQAVQQQNAMYEVNKFQQDYNQLLSISPALTNIMAQYVQSSRNPNNMYGQLNDVMNIVLPAYQEAFEAGKKFALQDKAKQDTSAVSGGIATANTQTYTPGATFTREQISKMSPAEFAKNESIIRQQMMEGKII